MSTEWLALVIAVGGIIVLPILWRAWLYVMYFLYFFIVNLATYRDTVRALKETRTIIGPDEEAHG